MKRRTRRKLKKGPIIFLFIVMTIIVGYLLFFKDNEGKIVEKKDKKIEEKVCH